ncbi:MAG: hypothetical protein DMF87_23650 [Acidobacteria bacterium]|nr:MAG: hypothetical protein DMF88_26615 [Acidobacteriota bacterium]PYR74130.1 MAG: hypothetical protein DMF87_23650 [Acidobacteriota bacterium]
MTAADFRRIAPSFEGAEEGSHMGAVDFRVGGRIFATRASRRTAARGLRHTRFGRIAASRSPGTRDPRRRRS